MAEKYSNREIDQMLRAVDDQADARHSEQMALLNSIKEQTTKTNGRVSKLEDGSTQQKQNAAVFKAQVTTAIAILVFLIGSVLVPLVIAYFTHSS